jgi:hypothetical protein
MKKYIAPLLLILSACGAKTGSPRVEGIDEYRRDLYSLREQVLSKSFLCKEGFYGVPYSDERCDSGDSVIFAGLSCLSGGRNCETVKRSQGEDGRWWRSPARVGTDTPPTFSRDQSKGVLAYLLRTKNTSAASKWLGYIRSENSRLCPDGIAHCGISAPLWSLFGDVWRALGLSPTSNMQTARAGDDAIRIREASRNSGYRLHLTALDSWLRRSANRGDRIDDTVTRIIHRRQPKNPFYAYLAGEYEIAAQETLKKCANSPSGSRRQWAWQREESEAAWKDSQGWDCIFIIDLLLADR